MDPWVTPTQQEIRSAVENAFGGHMERLIELAKVPSISGSDDTAHHLETTGTRVADLFSACGLDVNQVRHRGSPPYVLGRSEMKPERPTVLLYAHHDVHPVSGGWDTDPFEPTVRGDRLYGRGIADDKAGVMAHIAALEAWQEVTGDFPVNVKVIIEGEEEIGSPHLSGFLKRYGDSLAADVLVVTDVVNWDVGWPAVTLGLRGLLDVDITVSVSKTKLHSGLWGAAVPDAATVLIHLLASLHDAHGRVRVAGLVSDRELPAHLTEMKHLGVDGDELRSRAGLLDGVDFLEESPEAALAATWASPAITMVGVDLPTPDQSSHALQPSVRARLSVRLSPGQTIEDGFSALAAHLRGHVGWGAHLKIDQVAGGAGIRSVPEGDVFGALTSALRDAFNREPALVGCGGSIPFIRSLTDAVGAQPCLIGVEDPHTNAHGPNESLSLSDFQRVCLAEAFLLGELGGESFGEPRSFQQVS